jgi:SAM-dependent methyltransferase
MPEGWVWDESLFRGSAEYYERGRLPYPSHLAEVFGANADLSGEPRLIDVGCGPGTVALRLAHLFAAVVGVDADPRMVIEAERLATDAKVENVTWLNSRAEDLPADVGQFRYATFAQSFHWMNRELVAKKMFSMLEPGGAFVHVDTGHWGTAHAAESPHPPPPDQEMRVLVETYLGPERRAGQGILRHGTPSGEEEVLRAAGFLTPKAVPIPADGDRVIERSIDDVVAGVFSSSGSAPHLFAERVAEFERDLRALLERVTPTGKFAVMSGDLGLVFYRRP